MGDPGGAELAPNLEHMCFRDDLWLAQFPLNAATVLDYFAISPFYDRNCNNEKAKQQGIDPSRLMTLAPGVEYALQDCQEPHLYIIRKQHRATVHRAEPLAVYYVLDGSVYQSPTLYAVLHSRMRRLLHGVRSAFGVMRRDLDPLEREHDVVSQPVGVSHAALLAAYNAEKPSRSAAAAAAAGGAAGGAGTAAGAAGAVTASGAAAGAAGGAAATKSGAGAATTSAAVVAAVIDHREERKRTDRIIATVLSMHPLPPLLSKVQAITESAAASGGAALSAQQGQQATQQGGPAASHATQGAGAAQQAPSQNQQQQQQQGGGGGREAEVQPAKRARAS